MLKLADIYARKKEASGQVSSQTRSLALGFLAITWALLTAHDQPLQAMASHVNRYIVLVFATVAILVLVCDLLQYVAITNFTDKAYKTAAKATPQEGQYDEKSVAYRAQAFLYKAKFYLLSADAFLLLLILGLLFLPVRTSTSEAQQQILTSTGCSNTVISVSDTQASPSGSGPASRPPGLNPK
jgi:hypothetical protein